jgi:hypothetical protein
MSYRLALVDLRDKLATQYLDQGMGLEQNCMVAQALAQVVQALALDDIAIRYDVLDGELVADDNHNGDEPVGGDPREVGRQPAPEAVCSWGAVDQSPQGTAGLALGGSGLPEPDA